MTASQQATSSYSIRLYQTLSDYSASISPTKQAVDVCLPVWLAGSAGLAFRRRRRKEVGVSHPHATPHRRLRGNKTQQINHQTDRQIADLTEAHLTSQPAAVDWVAGQAICGEACALHTYLPVLDGDSIRFDSIRKTDRGREPFRRLCRSACPVTRRKQHHFLLSWQSDRSDKSDQSGRQ